VSTAAALLPQAFGLEAEGLQFGLYILIVRCKIP
jgi:hypothetical protein